MLVPRAGRRHVKLAPSTRPLCCEQGLTGKWNLCYIEAAILILSMVLCAGVMGTSDVMLVNNNLYLYQIALTLIVSFEAESSLESWLLLWGQTGVHPGIPKLLLWIAVILSHTCPCKCPHDVYSFVLTRLNYAALTWIVIQHVVFSTRFIKDM